MQDNGLWMLFQLIVMVGVSIGMYYIFRRKEQGQRKEPRNGPSEDKELRELRHMREHSLNVPLSEKTRPGSLDDIIGQQDGVSALRAAICGPNPQHVIIYGPPGVGKTCAARLLLEEAKLREDSPFTSYSRFVEVDATCVRFDERSIADPLMGSVHDPIYQGAGALGSQGVPQPKPGAVSRAHCGLLFLDEIGELHPMQMNKLLKVLEDRKVKFESAYYSKDNAHIPAHIHDIFQNGLPADFRLVGATTRSPEELPPAIRSRCMELYFKPLTVVELTKIVKGAAERIGYSISDNVAKRCAMFASSGRDAVNIVSLSSGKAYNELRREITIEDIDWVAHTCNYSIRMERAIRDIPRIGVVTGMAVQGNGQGAILEIECTAIRASKGAGSFEINGVVDEEELEMRGRKLRRKSTAKASVQNVCGAFYKRMKLDCRDFDIQLNIPGGTPMDGPSAGIAIAVALMSAITNQVPLSHMALTGEMGIQGDVLPVGGVREKIAAAIEAGATDIVIPQQNWEDEYASMPANILAVSDITEVMRFAFLKSPAKAGGEYVDDKLEQVDVLGAKCKN